MKKFIYTLLIFLAPFILLLAVVVVVDPFDMTGLSLVKGPLKWAIAKEIDYNRRYDFIRYTKFPTRNIIIGSSQAHRINPRDIPVKGWSQLSIRGGTISEMIEALHFATEYSRLDTVLMGIDPYNYGRSYQHAVSKDVTKGALELARHPYLYFTDRYVIEATFLSIKALFHTHVKSSHSAPDSLECEKAWQEELEWTAGYVKHPDDARGTKKALEEAVIDCHNHGITVICFNPLIHADLIKIEQPYCDSVYYRDMLDIFGTLYNFAFTNDYTCDRRNFGDPLHVLSDSVYIHTFWGCDTTHCKVMRREKGTITAPQ